MGSPVFSEVAASPVNFCHLFWDPAFNDVKFVQTYELLLQLNNLMNPAPLPLILCGDFNSEPVSAV